MGEWPVEKLCCFLKEPWLGGEGETGEMGRPVAEGLRAVWGGKPPVKVLGGAGGGREGERDC